MVTVRRDRLKRELREEILDAARRLFAAEGFASVSMRKVAEACGCAAGTIYLHFEDKDAILAAICLETFARLDQRMEAIRKDSGDPFDRLRRGGRTYAQFALDHPHHYIVTFGMARGRAMDEEETHRAGQNSFDCMRACVGACIEAGASPLNDVEAVAQALWACLHGVVMLLITKPEFPFIEQGRLIDTVIEIAIEGIRAR